MITHLSLIQSEEEVGMVSDGVDQNAILDRPEVQLDVQSAGGGRFHRKFGFNIGLTIMGAPVP